MDASGDGANATVSRDSAEGLTEVFRTGRCDLARLYRSATLLLGLRPDEHEYKVMGLAPYAPEREFQRAWELLKPLLQRVEDLDFVYEQERVPFELIFSTLRRQLSGARFDGIASAVQGYLETLIPTWIDVLLKRFGATSIAFAGGMAMNMKVNAAVAERCKPSRLYVPPGPGDESNAIGAAYAITSEVWRQLSMPIDFLRPMPNAFIGPDVAAKDAADVVDALVSEGFKARVVNNDDIARDLQKGQIIGRCSGKLEFGPRALGNRSILADPSNARAATRLNRVIKRRDFWMPFAPMVSAARANDYFELAEGIDARFMTIGCNAKHVCTVEAPAAIHSYDNSARPQVVEDGESGAGVSGILHAFEKRTGRGVLLNTSLNRHGEPIACYPEQAASIFRERELDGLVIGGWYITRTVACGPESGEDV